MTWRPAKRPGPGSYRVLAWVARLGTAGIEPAALALGLGPSAIKSHVARLEREGLLSRVSAGDGCGGVVVLTRAGAREAEATGATAIVAPSLIAASSARHGRAVSWIAASAELQGWQWLGPAGLRCESGWRVEREDGARHLPDLGIVLDGGRTAIEVELHRKSPRRTQAILRGYRGLVDARALTAVTYLCDRPDVMALVKREGTTAGLGDALQLGRLDAVVDRVRTMSAERRRARSQNSLSYS